MTQWLNDSPLVEASTAWANWLKADQWLLGDSIKTTQWCNQNRYIDVPYQCFDWRPHKQHAFVFLMLAQCSVPSLHCFSYRPWSLVLPKLRAIRLRSDELLGSNNAQALVVFRKPRSTEKLFICTTLVVRLLEKGLTWICLRLKPHKTMFTMIIRAPKLDFKNLCKHQATWAANGFDVSNIHSTQRPKTTSRPQGPHTWPRRPVGP